MNESIFLLDGAPVAEAGFVARAIDPAHCVAVDACAGSGKTTLLVRRIARCLLEGAEPESILAITFTRAAAQEMQVRIRGLLRRLAFESDERVLDLLRDQLCVPPAAAPGLLPLARRLYEDTLTARRGIDITTFHGWFWQLTRAGSRIGGAEPALELAERDAELLEEAWLGWLDLLREPQRIPLAQRFDRTVGLLGAGTTQSLLQSFVHQRTEWVASLGAECDFGDEAQALALALQSQEAANRRWLAALRGQSAAFGSWSDEQLAQDGLAALARHSGVLEQARRFAGLLGHGGAHQRKIALKLEAAVAQAALIDGTLSELAAWWQQLFEAMVTTAGKTRAINWQASAFGSRIHDAGGAAHLDAQWQALVGRMQACRGLVLDATDSLPLNRDLLACGASLACAYQAVKQARGVLDFVDLEAMAERLLRDESLSAYLQLRLDRRYRHLLFDEFQDTSSLQWTVIGNWLMAYAGAGAGTAPSVFIVGDPKQSIYRFRRAESRVFAAACDLLKQAFGASLLTTSTTRRNAPVIMQALNGCFIDCMPGFREQATLAAAPSSLVWRLPADPAPDVAAAAPGTASADEPFDWLCSRRDDSDSKRYAEGLTIGRAIEAARHRLGQGGELLPYREVIVLARSRAGFVEYERALRSLGIPVVSDRKGGLLTALESQDLVALLRFARDPNDDMALAQLLRSPLIGLPASSIADLADRRAGRSLMAALRDAAGSSCPGIAQRLDDWSRRARRLPIHDFLDSVVAQADAQAGYARCVDPAQVEIVVGNLQAMVGLALDHDGGRYPGLASFLYQLGALDRLDDRDSPDEGRPIQHDAVRLMTVHGAKGLEADLVVIADAAGSTRADGARFTIEWPPGEPRPLQAWFRLDASRIGYLSQELDRRERPLAAVEDWNLLYVAATRARRGLVISAQPVAKIGDDCWYDRLQSIPTPDAADDDGAESAGDEGATPAPEPMLRVPGLHLPVLAVGTRRERPPPGAGEPVAWPGSAQRPDDRAMKAGTAMHLALEHLTAGMDEERVAAVLSRQGLAAGVTSRALALAQVVRAMPALRDAFAPGAGHAEFELYDSDGQLLRIDRLCRVGDELWILDYKWSVASALLPGYSAQLAGYRRAIAQLPAPPLFDCPHRPVAIRTVLVDAAGATASFDIDLADPGDRQTNAR